MDSDSGSRSRVDSRGAAVRGEGCTVPGCVLGVRESQGCVQSSRQKGSLGCELSVPARSWSVSHSASSAVPDMSAGAQEMVSQGDQRR